MKEHDPIYYKMICDCEDIWAWMCDNVHRDKEENVLAKKYEQRCSLCQYHRQLRNGGCPSCVLTDLCNYGNGNVYQRSISSYASDDIKFMARQKIYMKVLAERLRIMEYYI